ncbi:hypothetical protein MHOCP_09100 [Moorella humiferrea]
MEKLNRDSNKVQNVGILSQKVISILGLNYSPKQILIGPSNIEHMKKKHPDCFDKYFEKIPEIISKPDYVGKHPSKDSIEYIKTFDEHILIAVRISQSGNLYVRSLYEISPERLKSYLESGTTFKL